MNCKTCDDNGVYDLGGWWGEQWCYDCNYWTRTPERRVWIKETMEEQNPYKNWGTSSEGLIYYGNPALPGATIPPWTRLPGWNENNSLSDEGDQTNLFYQELLKEIEESN